MYLNTYQLDPHVKFDPVRVKNIIEKLLDELFNDHVYNKQVCAIYEYFEYNVL